MAARNAMRFLPLKRLCTPSLRLFVSEESLFQVSGSVFLHPTRNVFRGHFDAAHNCRGHGRGKKMGSPDRTRETVQVPGLMESFVYSQAKSVAVDGSRGRGRERERVALAMNFRAGKGDFKCACFPSIDGSRGRAQAGT